MRDRFKEIVQTFFIIVTLVDAAMLILGRMFRPEQQFGYEIFIYPLIYGAIGCVPSLLMRERRELTVRQTVIREVVHVLLLVVLILAFLFGGRPVRPEDVPVAAGVAVSVVVIYGLVTVIGWALDLRTAKRMTEDLRRLQQRAAEEDETV